MYGFLLLFFFVSPSELCLERIKKRQKIINLYNKQDQINPCCFKI